MSLVLTSVDWTWVGVDSDWGTGVIVATGAAIFSGAEVDGSRVIVDSVDCTDVIAGVVVVGVSAEVDVDLGLSTGVVDWVSVTVVVEIRGDVAAGDVALGDVTGLVAVEVAVAELVATRAVEAWSDIFAVVVPDVDVSVRSVEPSSISSAVFDDFRNNTKKPSSIPQQSLKSEIKMLIPNWILLFYAENNIK